MHRSGTSTSGFRIPAILILAAVAALGAMPPPATEETYTLNRLRELAGRESLVIRMARIESGISRETWRDSRLLENPELELAWGRFNAEAMSAGRRIDEIAMQWRVPNPLVRVPRLRAGRLLMDMTKMAAETVRLNILRAVTESYHRLRFHLYRADLLYRRLAALEEVARITRVRVEIGEAREIDDLRANVAVERIRSQLLRSRREARVMSGHLNELLGNSLPQGFRVDRTPLFRPLELPAGDMEELLQDTPSTRRQRAQWQRAAALRRASAWAFMDAVSVFSVREREPEGRKWKVGLGLSLPLFNRGNHHLKVARYREEKAKLGLEHGLQHQRAEVQRRLARVRGLEDEIAALRGAAMRHSQQNLLLSDRLYREGEISLLLFLDAQDNYYELQAQVAEAVYDWGCEVAGLEALLGGIE